MSLSDVLVPISVTVDGIVLSVTNHFMHCCSLL